MMGTADTTAPTPEPPAQADGAGGSDPRNRTAGRRRRRWITALIAFTTLLSLVAMLSVWANRLVFNPDNWENASTQLLQNPDIRSATAGFLVDRVYATVNVAGVLSSSLPKRLQPLAGPAAGALRNAAVQGVELGLSRPRVQTLWAKANRAADQLFITIAKGGAGPVNVNRGVVSLNLAEIIDAMASRLGLPPNLSSKLPPSASQLTLFRANQLTFVQNVGNAIRGLALTLSIIVPLLFALAIGLSVGRRRRALMEVGWAVALAGLMGIAARKILISAIANSLTHDEALRPAIRATVGIGTSNLGEIAEAFILVGLVFVAAAWFAGPARMAFTARRTIAPFLRERPVESYAIAAAIMVLVFIWDPIPATGTPVGIIVFSLLALAATETLRRQTAVEFSDAQRGDAAGAGGWLRALRGGDRPPTPAQ